MKRFLTEAYDHAKEILKSNLGALHSMATALLEREVLDGKEIDEIIKAEGGMLPSGTLAGTPA